MKDRNPLETLRKERPRRVAIVTGALREVFAVRRLALLEVIDAIENDYIPSPETLELLDKKGLLLMSKYINNTALCIVAVWNREGYLENMLSHEQRTGKNTKYHTS